MSFSFLGPSPLDDQVNSVLARLAAGDSPNGIELPQVDVKEEPGRRRPGGVIIPGATQNEQAAQYLAGEMACFANTPGGGAIVLGVADKGGVIGTDLDEQWLRHRIWELTDNKLTVSVRAALLNGVRLLVLTTHEAIEPIRYGGRFRWRLNDNCVEIDATTWHSDRRQRTGFDWSAQASGHTLGDVSPLAVEIARRYLQAAGAAGDEGARDLGSATDADLLRRLHLVDADGRLTNAGSLLFVATPDIGIDYIRRDYSGGDSTMRVRSARSLLEQIFDVERASEAANRTVHVPDGFAHGQLRAIPLRAVREAIVNGVVHRDWLTPQPTTIEHIGDVVTVTSPGGFLGGVAPSNIITHPAVPRYRSLAEAVASLRLSEREGIGVDRMVRDMLALGHPEPEIAEVAGPMVRVSLVGGDPDRQILSLLAAMEPPSVLSDVDALLLLTRLASTGWVDVERAAPILQRSTIEARAAVDRLARATIAGSPVIVRIRGVPAGEAEAYRLSDEARAKLSGRTEQLVSGSGRNSLIRGWARARGRVSTTEIADMTGLSVPYVGGLLTSLEEEGLLVPGRENKRGRGFYYLPADTG
jgi:ATP-dependent DNA helicase RecG